MNVLMGIGNELKGDDGIGNVIAKEFRAPGWKSIDCGTVPENFASVVRREKPEILVIVDATEMGLEPGGIRIIPKKRLNSDVDSTHSMPLRFLVGELEKYTGRIVFIGIQPKSMDIGETLSGEVRKSMEKTLQIVQKSDFSGIKTL